MAHRHPPAPHQWKTSARKYHPAFYRTKLKKAFWTRETSLDSDCAATAAEFNLF